MYVFFGLSPLVNLVGNTVLLLLWGPAFGYLWFYTSATLTHVCNKKNWDGVVGIMVCRIYKALFAFSMFGTYVFTCKSSCLVDPADYSNRLCTLLAFILDVYVWRKSIARGKYAQMRDSEKPAGISAPGQPYNAPNYSDSRSSIAVEQYTAPQTERGDMSGYQVPEEQFAYDDTSYRGHEPTPAHQ